MLNPMVWKPNDDERVRPLDSSYFVPWEKVTEAFLDAPPIDAEEFWRDLDAFVDPAPREWPDP
jgi:hypothetical protein